MCLALPAEVLSVDNDGNAEVDYGGIRKTTRVDLVDAKVGDYVLIHAGFAIEVLDKETAQENIRAVQELMESENELENESS